MALTKRGHEAAIFQGFLNLCPGFAREPITDWKQPDLDPPDVLCVTASGRRIGVEMVSWLNKAETAFAAEHERRERAIMETICEQGGNTLVNVDWVWLHPKPRLRSIPPSERPDFRAELHAKLAEMDAALGADEHWNPHGLSCGDFSQYPTLAKYLTAVQCFPRKAWRDGQFIMQERISSQPWIHLPARGGCYDEDTMLQPLLDAIDAKRALYASRPAALDAFYLVIHYDRAWADNSPIETGTWKPDDVIHAAREHIAGDIGVFDGIFLYMAISPGTQVVRLA